MSSENPPFINTKKHKNNSPLDPIVEFKRLKMETDEISAKIRACAPLLNPDANTANEMLGVVLTELRMMRKEVKEMKENSDENKKSLKEIGENQKKLQEDVSQLQRDVTENKQCLEEMNLELKRQKKAVTDLSGLQGVLRELKSDVDGNRQRLEDMKLEQKNQREMLTEMKVNVSSDLKEIKEKQTRLETSVSKLKCQPTIRDLIFGKWRNLKSVTQYFSAKIEGDAYMQKWNDENSFSKYTLEEKYRNNLTVSVKNNKIVLRKSSDKGEETWRREIYIENGKLILTDFTPEKADKKFTFERIGDPDQ